MASDSRHSAGMDILPGSETNSARNTVRLRFSGEKVKVEELDAHPSIRPVRAGLHGQNIFVIPVMDLVRMKLSSNRDKDRVHIRGMDAAGLITNAVEAGLSEDLGFRLRHIR